MRVLDLFSGIGGFSLGLERAGMTTVAFCEINPFCRRVLAKHWPEMPIYEDVRELTAERLRADGVVPDLICGGFPCQDISKVGRGAGIGGERSGLWREFARIIEETRPRYIVGENSPVLRSRGLGRILNDLMALGYDAEWHCIPACRLGARHQRDRIWIVAYPEGSRAGVVLSEASLAGWRPAEGRAAGLRQSDGSASDLGASASSWWDAEPDVDRVVDGFPGRLDRERALGNAVVPQMLQMIGRAILAAEAT